MLFYPVEMETSIEIFGTPETLKFEGLTNLNKKHPVAHSLDPYTPSKNIM